MSKLPMKSRAALSRVDVLVILALFAVGLGILFPALYAAQVGDAARQTQNNLKQLSLSLHNFNDVYKRLPPAYGTVGNAKFGIDTSLHIHILPYIEQDNLFKEHFNAFKEGKEVAPALVPPYVSKLDPSLKKKKEEGIQNFPANLRVFADSGVMTAYDKDMPALRASEPGTGGIPRTFPDGTANTIVFATKYAYCGEGGSLYASRPNTKTAAFFGQNAAKKKAHPSDKEATFQLMPDAKDCLCSPLIAQTFMEKSIYVGLGDGSIRAVKADISPQTWNSAVQPNDGNRLGDDW